MKYLGGTEMRKAKVRDEITMDVWMCTAAAGIAFGVICAIAFMFPYGF